jgi:hypothetical protein
VAGAIYQDNNRKESPKFQMRWHLAIWLMGQWKGEAVDILSGPLNDFYSARLGLAVLVSGSASWEYMTRILGANLFFVD